MSKKLIVGNWKMLPEKVDDALELFDELKTRLSKIKGAEVVITPSFIFLPEITATYRGSRIQFGGQDIFYEKSGAYTGEVSASMLKGVGADYVILGHSERRRLGETNEDVQKKLESALSEKLTPILCVGESERDHGAEYLSFLREQIESAFKSISEKDAKKVMVAYEPIWAIGKSASEAMKAEQVHEMVLYIKKILSEHYSVPVAQKMKVLYGGSVEEGNVKELLAESEADGFLVGHASVDPEQFEAIVRAASES